MTKSNKGARQPTHEEITACARLIYEMEGRPEGKAVDHWLLAEALLLADFDEQSRRPRPAPDSSARAAKPAKPVSPQK